MDPMPRPPPILTKDEGEKGRGGDGRQYLGGWLNDAREARIEADGDANRDRPRGRDEKSRIDAAEGCGSSFEE
jgi:hypothetical protein